MMSVFAWSKKTAATCVLAALLTCDLVAQEYPPVGDSARWAMMDRYIELIPVLSSPGFAPEPHWLEDGQRFWYHAYQGDSSVILLADPVSGDLTEILDVERLRDALDGLEVEDVPRSGLPFQSLDLRDGDRIAVLRTPNATYELDVGPFELRVTSRSQSKSVEREEPVEPWTWIDGSMGSPGITSPDGSMVAAIRDQNVWIAWPKTGREMQLTFDGEELLRYDLFIPSGPDTWANWSPDSRHLILVRTDQRDLPKTPVIDWLGPTQEVLTPTDYSERGAAKQLLLHWNAGTEALKPFEVDMTGSDAVWLRVFGWNSDGSELFLGRSFFADRSEDVVALDPATGGVRTVVTEVGDVFPDAGGLTFFEGGFIWGSDRDGYRHLYRYDEGGQLVAQLTSGEFRTRDVLAIDENSGWVYFYADADLQRPHDRHLCRVRLDGTGFAVLTDEKGLHTVTLSPDLTYFLDQHESVARPPRTDLRRADGTFVRTLTSADLDEFKEKLRWVDAEEFVAKAADGVTDVWGALYKPYDFDPEKSYPVVQIVYTTVYDGLSWGFADLNTRIFSQMGLITVEMSLPGTNGTRSRAFRSAYYGRIGCCEHDDAAAVLQQLAADRPYMDLDRAGVLGGSWGSYHATRFMLMRPELFKVGIAERLQVGPGRGSTPFMGSPDSNAAGYAEASNVPLADRLEGKLLIVVNMLDVDVASAFQMIDALIEAEKPHDVLVVPGVGHLHQSWGGKGKAADHFIWERMMPAYMVEHLAGGR
jgi:dipeptidyl-peptidase-4